MLTQEENQTLARTGPDTPLGAAVRRYWVPALLSADLPEPGGDPIRVTLFNEDFVVFRTGAGTLGMLDEYCRHRSASLMLGRVDQCGIRCIYHGWKFAPDGTVLETPNVPSPQFRRQFKANAYPIREAGGLAWVYLGPAEFQPRFPQWPWFNLPAAQIIAARHYCQCNFVQVLEGLVDSAHLGILHRNALDASVTSDLTYAQKVSAMQFDRAPAIEVQTTRFGFRYAAIRTVGDLNSARVTSFVAPFTVVNPNGDVVTIVVPARDDLTMFFHVFWDEKRPIGVEPARSEHLRFIGLDPQTLDRIGVLRPDDPRAPHAHNHFYQNREAMRRDSFSGLPGLIAEDVIVSVASGTLRDRSTEMLSISDLAVAQLYRTLLGVAAAGAAGAQPTGVDVDPSVDARGFSIDNLTSVNWRELA